MSRENYTQGNRAAMPVIAGIVDAIRAQGLTVKVLYANEGGTKFDRREPVNPESIFDVPQGYAPMREVAKKEKHK